MKTTALFPGLLAAAALAGSCGTSAGGEAGRGRHRRLFVVPRPGEVTIDARLDDWDLSGQIWAYVVRQTAEMQSARFAAMYDDQALYLSAKVRDPNPLMNRHDPWVDGHKAWDADACQFRMVLDPEQGYPVRQSSFQPVPNDQMVHLILWYYTDRKEPNLQMHVGMDYQVPETATRPHGVVPHEKFQAAYREAPDGRGYTFEYRIPWKTLGARRPPGAGDIVAGTVQFNWSRPDGLKTAGGSAWAYDVMAGPGFPFQSSACWGKLIFSPEGDLPRELVEEGTPVEKPLPLAFRYRLPRDGEVSIALFDERGLCVRQLIAQGERRAGLNVEKWDGLDATGKPLEPGTYTWRGLVHEPLGTRFVLSVHNSGQPPYKTDDNTGGWGGDHGLPTDVAVAGQAVLLAWDVCESGWGIIRTDPEGKKQWGSKHSATYLATDGRRIFAAGGHGFEKGEGVKVFDIADSRPLNFANGSPTLAPPPDAPQFAIHQPERRYRPARRYGVDPNAVTGLACAGGRVYVAFRERDLIAVYDAAEGSLLATWPVPEPGRLAVRPDGSLAAVSRGAVVAVDEGTVKPLALFHLDEPTGIAAGPDGTLYVANRGRLQNVSVFGPDGAYVRSIGRRGGRPFVGRYDPSGMLEPAGIAVDGQGRLWVAEHLDGPKRVSVWDAATGELAAEFFGGSAYSTFAWMDPRHPDEVYCHNVLWRVDLDAGTWRPHSTCWRSREPNAVGGIGGGFFQALRVITAANGRQYGWANRHAIGPILFIREGGVFKPLVHFIRCIDGHSLTPWPPYPMFADKKRFPTGQWVWADANDDQAFQPDELTYLGQRARDRAFHWVDEHLNLWSGGGYVHRPVRIEDDGRPVYDFEKPEETGIRGRNGHGPIVVDPQDGSLYTNWPAHEPGFARWSPGGEMLWGYTGTVRWRDAINLPPVEPGDLYGPTCPLGVAGPFTGLATYFGPFHLFTRDGLYVGMVMRDGRRGGGLGPDVIACESFSGQLVKPEGTDRYFLLAGDQDGRITEVTGLDTVQRLEGGTYELSAEQARLAAKALADYQAAKAKAQRLTIVRGREALELAKGVGKTVDSRRGFTAKAAYDDEHLYVAFDVESPAPLTNAIPEPRLIFKGGNLLDIQMATDPEADPDREEPAPGDVRVLVTRQGGKPGAVVYRPRVEGFDGQPIVLESPTGKETFHAIERTERVELEVRERPGGFRAVAAIPLDLVGWKPRPGSTVRMDLGYIFGNATGTDAAIRAYWSNNSFTANVVDDIPHESRLEPDQWGTAAVE
ncbi:MAG: hypothetical protein ACLF0G_18020 [Candidatus Brocadiia bacterium]